jgi:hypothetical protein
MEGRMGGDDNIDDGITADAECGGIQKWRYEIMNQR